MSYFRAVVQTGCSEGRRLLLAVLDRTTRTRIGQLLGVSHNAVSCWGSGERTPSYGARRAMLVHLDIPMDAWDLDAVEAEPSSRRAA